MLPSLTQSDNLPGNGQPRGTPDRDRISNGNPSMSMADTTALPTLAATATTGASGDRTDHVIGLLVIAVLPALFWTAVIAVAAPLAGFDPSIKLLAGSAVAIATFLGCIASALRGTR